MWIAYLVVALALIGMAVAVRAVERNAADPASGRLVKVKVVNSRVEAELAAGLLRSAGIPAVTNFESVGDLYGLKVGPMAEVRVLVPVEQEAEARRLLESPAEDPPGSAGEGTLPTSRTTQP